MKPDGGNQADLLRLTPHEHVTMLFTDIEASTRHLQELGDGPWTALLAEHNELIASAVAEAGGRTVKTEGDSFFVVFAEADRAIAGALLAQQRLLQHPWGTAAPLRVRMSLHSGDVRLLGDDCIGLAVHEAARLSAVGHGGQILVSDAVRRESTGVPEGSSFASLGEHVLRDFPNPQPLYQLCHPALPKDFPPLRTSTAVTHNLPKSATPLLGRSQELSEALQLLLSAARLITVTGPGGVGKTRLALEVAREALPHFPGGVWLAPLDRLAPGSALLPEVSRLIGFTQDPGADVAGALARSLDGRGKCLLVLDNVEHLLNDSAGVARLLGEQEALTVLATSRERLRIRGEHLLELAPLAADAAVELFQARAAEAFPTSLAASDEEVVRGICKQLEGMPLGIELAVGRLGLGVDALANSLQSGFDLVAGGGEELHPRQRAITATIAWSVDLLTDEQRSALATLSLFPGGATAAAAAAVTGSAESVAALIDKSLLSQRDSRLWMLESVRQFAKARLGAIEVQSEATRRVTDWYLDVVQSASAALAGLQQVSALTSLDDDYPNIQAVLQSLHLRDTRQLQRLAAQLGRYWEIRGRWQEGGELLELAVGLGHITEWFGECLLWAGRLAVHRGEHEVARMRLDDGLRVCLEGGDPLGAGRCLDGLGEAARCRHDLDEAARHYEQALLVFASINSATDAAATKQNQGVLAAQRGDLAEAERNFLDALGPLREAGDERRAARVCVNLGSVLVDQGRFDVAARYLEESLEAFNRLGDREGLSAALSNIGHLLTSSGDRDGARTPLMEALIVARELGDQVAIGRNVLNLDDVGCGTAELLREGLSAHRATGSPQGIARCAHRLGQVALAQGDLVGAREALLEASQHYDEMGMTTLLVSVQLTLAEIADDLALAADARELRQRAATAIRSHPDPTAIVQPLLLDARLGQKPEREAWLQALDLTPPPATR